jgi:hypothetical protein
VNHPQVGVAARFAPDVIHNPALLVLGRSRKFRWLRNTSSGNVPLQPRRLMIAPAAVGGKRLLGRR